MNFTQSLCGATCFATILLGSTVASNLQAAEEPFKCPLDANHPFLGKPVFDVQKNLTADTGEAEIDGKKVRLDRYVSFQVAHDGSILLFWSQSEKGLIYVRRSEDGGKTWGSPIVVGALSEIDDWYARVPGHFGKTILGSSMIDETTGDVLVFTSAFKPAPVLHRSRDHGETWSTEGITIKKDKNGWLPCFNAACNPGATLKYGPKKGRLLMPTRVFVQGLNYDPKEGPKVFDKHYTNAAYSDDHGKTWTPSEPFPFKGTGESGLAEMSDGRIYLNSRIHIRGGNRRIAWSTDGGETWEGEYESKYLPDGPPDVYGCKGGLVRLPIQDADVLVYSSPKDHHTKHRKPITVRASFDGATTWPVARTLPDGEIAGYTWLGAGRAGTPSEGTIYLLSQTREFVRFNLAWMLEQNEFVEPTLDLPVGSQETGADTGENREFGIIDNSDDMRRIPVKEVASLMKEIGYKSVAVSTEEPQFNERMNAFRKASLRIGGVSLKWTTDGKSDSFNIPWDLVLSKVRDTGAIIMFGISVKGGATVTDERIVEQLKARAKQAEKAGVILAIYPHIGFRISKFDHAHRIADAVNHPALGICFVLCHYMKQSDEKDIPAKLRAAKGRLVTAIINGSPIGNTNAMRFDRLVQHIDQGEYDLAALLDLLCGELEFKGPIYVQCVNMQAPTRETLEATHRKWQTLKRHCRVPFNGGKTD